MKWIDYREKLGVGFADPQKAEMLKNKVKIYLLGLNEVLYQISDEKAHLSFDFTFKEYFYSVGECPYRENYCLISVLNSITAPTSVLEVISKFVAFQNVAADYIKDESAVKVIKNVFLGFLDELKINYELYEDSDGVFIFPKGAPELDAALVSEPLDWMAKYPNAQKAWIKALKDYSEQSDENASDIADKFRKALETFFQEFFGGGKSLENYKTEYGDFLKSHGVPAELSGNYQKLLESYTNYINNYAKHQDKTSRNVLEYIMYQSGNIIRLLITLREGETI